MIAIPFIASLAALGFVAYLVQYVLSKPHGTKRMEELSGFVQSGAQAFLKREFTYVAPFVVGIVILFAIMGSAYPEYHLNIKTGAAFAFGALASALAGYVGMMIATRSNSRTANAAREGGLNAALDVAVSGGAVMGMTVVGVALFGLCVTYVVFFDHSSAEKAAETVNVINGYAMGASLVALFARCGGGIFTKGADMGADLVGKVEAGIPEDDPRNPAVIADNVGDNVGDVAGLGADLMESYVEAIIVTMALAVAIGATTLSDGASAAKAGETMNSLIMLPFLIAAAGIAGSIAGIWSTKNIDEVLRWVGLASDAVKGASKPPEPTGKPASGSPSARRDAERRQKQGGKKTHGGGQSQKKANAGGSSAKKENKEAKAEADAANDEAESAEASSDEADESGEAAAPKATEKKSSKPAAKPEGLGADPQKALMLGTYIAAGATIVLTFLVVAIFGTEFTEHASGEATTYGKYGPFWATLLGIVAGAAIGFLTEFYTSAKFGSVKRIAKNSQSGPAITVTEGISVGMASTALPVIVLALALMGAFAAAGMYGVGMAAFGMLATTGMIVAVDSYGPIADNAGGIAEMAHLDPSVRKITDNLDAVGNTTAAIGKGFAIGSAAFAALGLVVAYTVAVDLKIVDVTAPTVLGGLLIGAMLPYAFSSLLFNAVSDSAFLMIEEVRRQFRNTPGLKEGKEGVVPEYASCVDIATKGAIKGMMLPGAAAIAAPVIVGLAFGKGALAGMLVGALASGVMLGIQCATSGGAMDNAKKYVEEGHFGGKGSDTHKATVIGDTVGDPLKDTVGPSINILIKLMAIISLVLAPMFKAIGK